ncbi:MAG: 50S ribosomal protein L14 [Candidatus Omnitrophota bacterium]
MIQLKSVLDVADNTGARQAYFVGVLGKKGSPFAQIGDIVRVIVKEAAADAAIKKGTNSKAVIVRQHYPIRRPDGSFVSFDHNAVVMIDDQLNPKGTRVFGPVARELRDRNFMKIISLAPEVV